MMLNPFGPFLRIMRYGVDGCPLGGCGPHRCRDGVPGRGRRPRPAQVSSARSAEIGRNPPPALQVRGNRHARRRPRGRDCGVFADLEPAAACSGAIDPRICVRPGGPRVERRRAEPAYARRTRRRTAPPARRSRHRAAVRARRPLVRRTRRPRLCARPSSRRGGSRLRRSIASGRMVRPFAATATDASRRDLPLESGSGARPARRGTAQPGAADRRRSSGAAAVQPAVRAIRRGPASAHDRRGAEASGGGIAGRAGALVEPEGVSGHVAASCGDAGMLL